MSDKTQICASFWYCDFQWSKVLYRKIVNRLSSGKFDLVYVDGSEAFVGPEATPNVALHNLK